MTAGSEDERREQAVDDGAGDGLDRLDGAFADEPDRVVDRVRRRRWSSRSCPRPRRGLGRAAYMAAAAASRAGAGVRAAGCGSTSEQSARRERRTAYGLPRRRRPGSYDRLPVRPCRSRRAPAPSRTAMRSARRRSRTPVRRPEPRLRGGVLGRRCRVEPVERSRCRDRTGACRVDDRARLRSTRLGSRAASRGAVTRRRRCTSPKSAGA